jgi:hypothetical protein
MAMIRMRVTEGRFALEGNSDGRGHDDRVGRRDRPGAIGRGVARSVGSVTQRGDGRSRSTGCPERLSNAVPAIGESGAGHGISGGAGGAAGAGHRGRLIDSSKGPWIVTVTDAEPEPDPAGDATNSAGRDAHPVGGTDAYADARRHADANADAETHEATEEPEATEVAATAVIRRAMLLQREGGTSTRP